MVKDKWREKVHLALTFCGPHPPSDADIARAFGGRPDSPVCCTFFHVIYQAGEACAVFFGLIEIKGRTFEPQLFLEQGKIFQCYSREIGL